MLRTGQKLSTTVRTVAASTAATNHTGASGTGGGVDTGTTRENAVASTALNASRIVSQFSHAKLPEATSHSCVTITIPAATDATGCGANSANGTTSCATWLPATSIRCSGLGRWWKNQLNGPGIGWVSWW